METKRLILVFGNSDILKALVPVLRVSPLLHVIEQDADQASAALEELRPDVIVVDAAQVTPEQFCELIEICPNIISLDPDTCQLTVFSSPRHANTIAEVARVIGALSFTLRQPA